MICVEIKDLPIFAVSFNNNCCQPTDDFFFSSNFELSVME